MEKKLGLIALTALVLSSMLGAGIFSLPQNMAQVAGPLALLIGWGITGVGILFLACAMLWLTRLRPDLDGGIFTYAKEGFGELIGFFSAWGYWLCAVIANASYLVIVFAALALFTDSGGNIIFGEGNTLPALFGESVLLWLIHILILRGIQTAAIINLITTLAKLLPLGLFAILAALAFNVEAFSADFHGISFGYPVWQQVKDTMLITLWVFIGVEGAIVVSARARNKKDVGIATLFAVLSALIIYLTITLLSLGIVPREELAQMHNPSMALLMVKLIGPLGNALIVAGLIISVSGAYLSWTIMAAEVPFMAAQHGLFPKYFRQQNKKHTPNASLWLTNSAVQLALLLIWAIGSNYNTLLTIASEMVLVPYFLVSAFLLKLVLAQRNYRLLWLAIGACIYGLWLLYAAGLINLLMAVLLYLPGLLIFIYTYNEQNTKQLNKLEKGGILLLLIASAPASWLILH